MSEALSKKAIRGVLASLTGEFDGARSVMKARPNDYTGGYLDALDFAITALSSALGDTGGCCGHPPHDSGQCEYFTAPRTSFPGSIERCDCKAGNGGRCACGHYPVDHDEDDGCGACAMAMVGPCRTYRPR